MAQWEFVEWFLLWLLETNDFEFDWDGGNSTKNSQKHGVEVHEVESVFRSGKALPLGLQISPKTDEQRFGVIGPNEEGRLLQIAFAFRGDKIRVISARPASKKETARYEEILRKISETI